ncbi:hypothetical protein [Hydrogenivirga sp. 128-5-R1-1]|uniref:hypothetical protein n=1 Tax=Hydrogenivirga sp. 128-5-R1-1 TaxID=392423 RepID=UPI00015EF751|nr:hypothetical protein [Hydrogenivirga sp. 128-5-R1-1]EDP74898.1 hypothetical protein HG1285_13557 [Hydrogenivirga sp. 128-5-R1-1]
MADFRKAGLDRGDIRAELKNFLLSIRIRREEYMNIIDELEPDELEYDLREYREYFEKQVKPLYEQAHAVGVKSLIELAEEVKGVYDEIIELIEKKLSDV